MTNKQVNRPTKGHNITSLSEVPNVIQIALCPNADVGTWKSLGKVMNNKRSPIYTFAKHSFIINKSPFCIKTGMLQPWHFTGSQPTATTQLAKTAGGNTLISLSKGEPSDNGETRMKKSSQPQKYLQVENNNKQV